MTFAEFLINNAGAFFGFLGAALAAGLACVGSRQGHRPRRRGGRRSAGRGPLPVFQVHDPAGYPRHPGLVWPGHRLFWP